jgi:hypothetical protein
MFTFFTFIKGTWNMGSWKILANKKFKYHLQCQNLMDFHVCICQTHFNLVEYKIFVVKMGDDLVGM